MIQIDLRVMGETVATHLFSEKQEAKAYYKRFENNLSCYALVILEGDPLTWAQAHRYFGLPEAWSEEERAGAARPPDLIPRNPPPPAGPQSNPAGC